MGIDWLNLCGLLIRGGRHREIFVPNLQHASLNLTIIYICGPDRPGFERKLAIVTSNSNPVTHTTTDLDLAETVRNWWSAVESGRIDAAAEVLADDVVWEVMHVGEHMLHGGVFTGKDVVRTDLLEVMPKAFYDPDQTQFKITELYVAGNVVIYETTINAVTIKGRTMEDAKYISIATFNEQGKIRHIREYPDALKAKAAHLD